MFGARNQSHPSRAWLLIPVLGIIVVLGVAAVLFFHGPPAIGAYPWYGWWFPFPWFFIIPVIFFVFLVFRWTFWGGWGWRGGWYYGQYNDPAVEIVKQRFARGEITKEQFDQMVKDPNEAERIYVTFRVTPELLGVAIFFAGRV